MSQHRYGRTRYRQDDIAWADEQLCEALHELRVGRAASAEDWIMSAHKIIREMAEGQQAHWWGRWARSRASPLHLEMLRRRYG